MNEDNKPLIKKINRVSNYLHIGNVKGSKKYLGRATWSNYTYDEYLVMRMEACLYHLYNYTDMKHCSEAKFCLELTNSHDRANILMAFNILYETNKFRWKKKQ